MPKAKRAINNFCPNLVFQNSSIWIFDKPAGISVQGGHGVKYAFIDLLAAFLEQPVFLVHRLDKETSGLLLVAKNRQAADRYAFYFKTGMVEKHYKAVAMGSPARHFSMVGPIWEQNKPRDAQTDARVEQYLTDGYVLLDVHPKTGRKHQIRIHLKQAGYPIVGDDKYGDFAGNRELAKATDSLSRLFLHASSIAIAKENINVCAPQPDYFKSFIRSYEKKLRR